MTNSKFIRSMTDKDLARFIGGIADCCGCPVGVCANPECCTENLVKYLNSEFDQERFECNLMPDPEVGA